jgi:hypothetical protein
MALILKILLSSCPDGFQHWQLPDHFHTYQATGETLCDFSTSGEMQQALFRE